MQCKTHDHTFRDALQMMHLAFRNALFEFEARCYLSITGKYLSRIVIETWTPNEHKLCLLYACHTMLKEEPFQCLKMQDSAQCVEQLKKLISEQSQCKVKWSKFLLKSQVITPHALHKSVLHCLRDVDVSARNVREQLCMDTIHIIFQKHFYPHFPLEVTLLTEVASNNLASCLKKLKELQHNKGHLNATVSQTLCSLTMEEKKLVKFCLLYYKKLEQFFIRYVDFETSTLKCTASKSDPVSEDIYFIACNYCMEMLTFRDISKRPPSFGPYLHSEMLEMRCFRCDSTDLLILPCCNVTKNVYLQFSHPDRQPVSVCKGHRTCFNVTGHPSQICFKCQVSKRPVHDGTCLTRCASVENVCDSCKGITRSNAGLTKDNDNTDSSLTNQDDIQDKEPKITAKSRGMMRRFEHACKKAKLYKDRRLLIK